jgi:hypothetical protein
VVTPEQVEADDRSVCRGRAIRGRAE